MQDAQNQKLGTGWALVSSPVSLTAEGEGGSSDEMLFKASPSRAHGHEGVSETHGMAASGGWTVSPPSILDTTVSLTSLAIY